MSWKSVLLTAGAICSFVTMFALFGLIFYQLFRPDHDPQAQASSSSSFSSSPSAGGPSSSLHPLSGTLPPSSSPSSTPPPPPPEEYPSSSASPPPYIPSPPSSSSSPSNSPPPPTHRHLRKLWEARGGRDRAKLLVQSVNLNPNSTWSAQLNRHAIGLKPLSEMLNFSKNFDPLNSTFMMDPGRLRTIQQLIEKKFHPLYDQHLDEMEKRHSAPGASSLPDRFNAAQRWPKCAQSILKVRDQGGCGSCWAVAAVSVISDRTCIASAGRVKESMSAQQLVECCDYCGGCTGAPNSFFPFLYWHQEGLVSDQCFPYTIARDCGHPCPPTEFEHPRGLGNCSCRDQCADRRTPATRHRAKYVYKIGSLDEDEHFFPPSLFHRLKSQPARFPSGKNARAVDLLKRELVAHGPVMLCFSVFEGFMHYYEGVYSFDLVPGELHVYDHCVKVIGWGRQRRPNGQQQQEYLLLVNSWSSLWAKDGTFKMDLDHLAHSHSDLFAGVPLL